MVADGSLSQRSGTPPLLVIALNRQWRAGTRRLLAAQTPDAGERRRVRSGDRRFLGAKVTLKRDDAGGRFVMDGRFRLSNAVGME